MRNLFPILIAVPLIASLFLPNKVSAQVPQKMSYQAVVRDSSNKLATSESIGIRITILRGSASGISVYTETQTPSTNANGLVSIEIGGNTNFDTINWAHGLYFLKTEIDPTGGSNYTITGTSQLLSVPFSLYAEKAGNIDQLIRKISALEEVLFNGGLYNAKDIDGNLYGAIKIGTQVWMSKNLKTTKYRNGDTIPNVHIDSLWQSSTNGAYCNFNNLDSIASTFGHLYNFYTTIDSRGLCPSGWHVPSDSEWTVLSNYLGGDSIAGAKIKETGTIHWIGSNIGATNSSGFTAIPGGYRAAMGSFSELGGYGVWWSSTESNSSQAFYRYVRGSSKEIFKGSPVKKDGYSVRCIRD